jgi:hypothetical protein
LIHCEAARGSRGSRLATSGSSASNEIRATGKAVTDATGVVWSEHAINESMMTIDVFAVVAFAFLATVKLARNDIAGSLTAGRL